MQPHMFSHQNPYHQQQHHPAHAQNHHQYAQSQAAAAANAAAQQQHYGRMGGQNGNGNNGNGMNQGLGGGQRDSGMDHGPGSIFSGPGEQMSEDNRRVLEWIAQVLNANTRESALLELSKKREQVPELALILWHSFGMLQRGLSDMAGWLTVA